jgi:ribonuclease-3
MQSNLEELEQALGHRFTDRALLVRAVTHSSSANETQGPEAGSGAIDNERLEFLGDAVLGWLVSDWIFARFGSFSEGQLSVVKNHLVSAAHLLDVAHRLDLGRYLQLGRGEETAGGRSKQRLLVNAFEAVLAAVYLDGGPDPARSLLSRFLIPDDEALTRLAGAGPPQDFRAELERLA